MSDIAHVDRTQPNYRLESMTQRRKFVYDPDSPSQRRANALALADQKLHSDLIQARKDSGMSQGDVAQLMGVSQPTVASFERYDNDPKLSTVRRYAHVVGVTIEHRVVREDGHPGAWERLVSRRPLPARIPVLPESLAALSRADYVSVRSDFSPAA